MKIDLEFALKKEELEFISKVLDDRYPLDAISWIHQGMLVSPRLISIGVLSGPDNVNLLDPDFRISTIHVATTMRILGMSKYGLLYFTVFDQLNIKGWEDVNYIILAMQTVYKKTNQKVPALWLSSIVDLKESNERVFLEDPFLKDTIPDEIDFCDVILQRAFDISDEEMKSRVQTGFEKFIEDLSLLLKRDNEDDITNLTDDDVVE